MTSQPSRQASLEDRWQPHHGVRVATRTIVFRLVVSPRWQILLVLLELSPRETATVPAETYCGGMLLEPADRRVKARGDGITSSSRLDSGDHVGKGLLRPSRCAVADE